MPVKQCRNFDEERSSSRKRTAHEFHHAKSDGTKHLDETQVEHARKDALLAIKYQSSSDRAVN